MSTTKSDFLYLGILVLLSAIIGALFISTAVLITDDGVVYIHDAQKWGQSPWEVFTSKSPGYSFSSSFAIVPS